MEIKFLNYLFNYVVITSKLFNIDESHSLKHSMDVYYYSERILDMELNKYPYLKNHKNIIFSSAILHDMCDKKYINEKIGIENIINYMNDKMDPNELFTMVEIISTMSYSTVKKNGFPSLGVYDMCYHIVREADLLASYDFDRCIIYQMLKNNDDYENSFYNAKELFEKRVFKYNEDNLFKTEYAKSISHVLHLEAFNKINNLSKIFCKVL
jgi:HD superfamily phosphodiesterase